MSLPYSPLDLDPGSDEDSYWTDERAGAQRSEAELGSGECCGYCGCHQSGHAARPSVESLAELAQRP